MARVDLDDSASDLADERRYLLVAIEDAINKLLESIGPDKSCLILVQAVANALMGF